MPNTNFSYKLIYFMFTPAALTKYDNISIGSGKTIVEFFSADIVFNVWNGRREEKIEKKCERDELD